MPVINKYTGYRYQHLKYGQPYYILIKPGQGESIEQQMLTADMLITDK